ncbi:MAG: hypothetical protein IT427_14145 [Pirellulales bacterium]|nr:hypothetical protein [Pirellulales bacterium]
MRTASFRTAAALICLAAPLAFGQSPTSKLDAKDPSGQMAGQMGEVVGTGRMLGDANDFGDSLSGFQNSAPEVGIEAGAFDPVNLAAPRPVDRDGSPCDAYASDCTPRWDFQFLSLLLWRDNDSQNSELIRPNIIDFGGGGGPKLLGRYRMNSNQAWEALWYAVGHDNGKRFYNWSNFYLTDYRSSLSNGEINYVHTWNRFSLLGGFRTLRWSETYEELYTPAGTQLQMHTDNDLFGGQVGSRWRKDHENSFWEVTGKVGVFGNQANDSQILTYGYGTSGSTAFPRHYDFATSIVYDLNVSLGCRLSPVWSLRTGYNFIFIDRLALAPNQYSPNGQRGLGIQGNVMLNGLEVGLEALW